MEWIIKAGNYPVTVQKTTLGRDLLITVKGGTAHVGCVVLAIPRESLTGDASTSCTSSVMNVVGHKDEMICRYLAEKAAKKYKVTVVCTGGIHIDGITKEEIEDLTQQMQTIDL